ncbi:MAG: TolC family protein, partial [Pseudomonadota bacterium]
LAEISESKRVADISYEEFFGAAPQAALPRPAFQDLGIETRNEVVANALEHNPEIAAAQARADARQADFKASKAARLPEVRLSVDAVKYDVFETGDDFDVRAGLNVSYNIFGGGARAADIAAAKSRARRETFNEEQVRQTVSREAAMAFERLQGANDRLSALGDALIAHDTTRELVLERYKLSRGDLIDVLQAENDYFEAGVAYVIALSGRDMASYALMEHTGELLQLFSPQIEYENATTGHAR